MGSLFAPKTPKVQPMKPPEMPEVPPPTRMPTLASSSVQEQRRLAQRNSMRRKGRRSTILTDRDNGSTTLGGV